VALQATFPQVRANVIGQPRTVSGAVCASSSPALGAGRRRFRTAAELNDEDQSYVWTFLDEARGPAQITPGAPDAFQHLRNPQSSKPFTTGKPRLRERHQT
jgi:hypothetical protein